MISSESKEDGRVDGKVWDVDCQQMLEWAKEREDGKIFVVFEVEL